ncbi:unnamed protein product [Rotaria sordida]|uniref:Transmembrane protein n=1 Tax=Rotaria sordida TaxID=392033 RepID=A0A814H6P7_9BILA|nr:unnamed protein product [Rotaria sordida]CAF1107572.1 unnamed protein product [Rotaria sordida]
MIKKSNTRQYDQKHQLIYELEILVRLYFSNIYIYIAHVCLFICLSFFYNFNRTYFILKYVSNDTLASSNLKFYQHLNNT